MLAPVSWRTPPIAYGPWELVTSLLTEALVARGVDVTLFATLNSVTAATLVGVVPHGYSERPGLDAKVWELLHIARVVERAGEFDLIHNQADFVPLFFSRLIDTPMVTTLHGLSSDRILPVYEQYDDRVTYVSISDADRAPSLTYAATIHHGIPIDDFDFNAVGSEALLFFGRIHPDKGAGEAIRAARSAGRRLIMCGLVQDEAYHEQEVAPFVDGDKVEFRGVIGGPERIRTLGSARGLLHLIDFEEPFGLSVIEAMACGTPVIAYNRGSMPELIEHGVTGFLADTFDDVLSAIGQLDQIERRACRAAVTAQFSVERMADEYLSLYERILGRSA
jgi:glycosyltransferase involved in cell wall biosynthesis